MIEPLRLNLIFILWSTFLVDWSIWWLYITFHTPNEICYSMLKLTTTWSTCISNMTRNHLLEPNQIVATSACIKLHVPLMKTILFNLRPLCNNIVLGWFHILHVYHHCKFILIYLYISSIMSLYICYCYCTSTHKFVKTFVHFVWLINWIEKTIECFQWFEQCDLCWCRLVDTAVVADEDQIHLKEMKRPSSAHSFSNRVSPSPDQDADTEWDSVLTRTQTQSETQSWHRNRVIPTYNTC